MGLKSIAAVMAAFGVSFSAASAAPVKVTFEGVIGLYSGFTSQTSAAGERLAVSFIIDPDTPGTVTVPGSGGQTRTRYMTEGLEITFLPNGQTFRGDNIGNLEILEGDSRPGTSDSFVYSNSGPADNFGIESLQILGIVSPGASPFSPDRLLAEFLDVARSGDLSAFVITQLVADFVVRDSVFGDCGSSTCQVFATFDSISLTQVPVPAALPLMGAGIAALGWAGRRRKKQSQAVAA